MTEPLLPSLAKDIAVWFPELEGRAIAVAEAEITRENMPKLPLCMVALLREDAKDSWTSSNNKIALVDDFMVEFLLAPEKYVRPDGSSTPFWAFYDYEALRDRLLNKTKVWRGPGQQRLEYVSLSVDADAFAVSVSMRFRAHVDWCRDEEVAAGDGVPARIAVNICKPKSTYCGPEFEPEKEDCTTCP